MRILHKNHVEDEIMGEQSGSDPTRIVIGRKVGKNKNVTKPPSSITSRTTRGSSVISSPSIKGPRRYLTVAQGQSLLNAKPAPVSRSRLLVKGITGAKKSKVKNLALEVTPSLPTRIQSPGKAQNRSPCASPPRVIPLNGLREDFSPSPVISRRRRSPTFSPPELVKKNSNLDVHVEVERLSSDIVRKHLPQAENCQDEEFVSSTSKLEAVDPMETEETVVQDPQICDDEIGYYPLPKNVPFQPRLTRPSDSDLGFEKPKEVNQVPVNPSNSPKSAEIFKVPAPPSLPRQQFQEIDHVELEKQYLHSWIPRLKNEKLYIEGDLMDLDTSKDISSEMSRRYMTSRIVRRVSSNVVATKKRQYVLEGPLAIISLEDEKEKKTPFFILDKFQFGFPENWERYLRHWIKLEKQIDKNISNMTLLSSTLLSNFSAMGNFSTANLTSNLSAIPNASANSSGFMKNTTLSSNVPSVASVPYSARAELSAVVEETLDDVPPVEKIQRSLETTNESNQHRRNNASRSKKSRLSPKQKSKANVDLVEANVTENLNQNEVIDEIHEASVRVTSKQSKMAEEAHLVNEILEKSLEDDEVAAHFCIHCKFSSNDVEEFRAHMELEEHLENTRLKTRNAIMLCKVCNMSFKKDRDVVRHLSTIKHTKALAKAMSNEPSKKISSKRNKEPAKPITTVDANMEEKEADEEDQTRVAGKKQNRGTTKSILKVSKQLKVPESTINEQLEDADVEEHADIPKSKKQLQGSSKTNKEHVRLSKESDQILLPTNDNPDEDDNETHETNVTHSRRLTRKPNQAKENFKVPSKRAASKKVKEPVPSLPPANEEHEEEDDEVNESRFGRKRVLNRRYNRQSCVYNTPEETAKTSKSKKVSKKIPVSVRSTDAEKETAKATKSKKASKKVPVSLPSPDVESVVSKTTQPKGRKRKLQEVEKIKETSRRTVLNPFKKISNTDTEVPTEPVKDVESILKKIKVKPKTIKDRIQNVDALDEYNENHEDDVFNEPPKKANKITSKATLLSLDDDSDSDQDISVHSARTPVTAYFSKSSLRESLGDKTPGILEQQLDSPTILPANKMKKQQFIQRTLVQRDKNDRQRRKNLLTSALTAVVSRNSMDKLVDQSTKVIGQMSQKTNGDVGNDEDEVDDWFDDDSNSNDGLLGR